MSDIGKIIDAAGNIASVIAMLLTIPTTVVVIRRRRRHRRPEPPSAGNGVQPNPSHSQQPDR